MTRRNVLFGILGAPLMFNACATEPSAPPASIYLVAGPSPKAPAQVEVQKGSLIQVRSGDILLESQAELIVGKVGVHFYVINLSDEILTLNAKDFSLLDAHEKESRQLTVKEILDPLRSQAAQLTPTLDTKNKPQMRSADAVLNPEETYNGGSTNERITKSLRGESKRLEKTLQPSFVSAQVPINKKVYGTVYFERPSSWPATLKVEAGGQILLSDVYAVGVNP